MRRGRPRVPRRRLPRPKRLPSTRPRPPSTRSRSRTRRTAAPRSTRSVSWPRSRRDGARRTPRARRSGASARRSDASATPSARRTRGSYRRSREGQPPHAHSRRAPPTRGRTDRNPPPRARNPPPPTCHRSKRRAARREATPPPPLRSKPPPPPPSRSPPRSWTPTRTRATRCTRWRSARSRSRSRTGPGPSSRPGRGTARRDAAASPLIDADAGATRRADAAAAWRSRCSNGSEQPSNSLVGSSAGTPPGGIYALAFSPVLADDGLGVLAAASGDGTCRLFDWRGGGETARVEVGAEVNGVAWHRSNPSRLAAVSDEGVALVWDVEKITTGRRGESTCRTSRMTSRFYHAARDPTPPENDHPPSESLYRAGVPGVVASFIGATSRERCLVSKAPIILGFQAPPSPKPPSPPAPMYDVAWAPRESPAGADVLVTAALGNGEGVKGVAKVWDTRAPASHGSTHGSSTHGTHGSTHGSTVVLTLPAVPRSLAWRLSGATRTTWSGATSRPAPTGGSPPGRTTGRSGYGTRGAGTRPSRPRGSVRRRSSACGSRRRATAAGG